MRRGTAFVDRPELKAKMSMQPKQALILDKCSALLSALLNCSTLANLLSRRVEELASSPLFSLALSPLPVRGWSGYATFQLSQICSVLK